MEKARLGEYLIAAFSYLMGDSRKDRVSFVRGVQKRIKCNEHKLQQVKFWK